jgi:hypothetical protein
MSNSTTTIPNKDSEFLLWVGERAALWSANFSRVGLTQDDANEMKAATSASQAAYTNWLNAQRAAKEANEQWRAAKAANRAIATAGVKTVRTFASRSSNPTEVYTLSGVPAPKTPNFGVPPGQPFGAVVTLNVVTGALEFRFECNNPPGLTGTVYLASRRTVSTTGVFGPWTQVAVSSVKRFIDNTVIQGTPAVQYQITAQRGSIVGAPSLPVTVSFGRAGNGGGGPGQGLTVTEGEFVPTSTKTPKLAA